jgi:hypothetical protein
MNMRKFDLNIEEVLEDWEVYHAIREIIANALDEQALTNTKEIEIRKENGEYVIRDFGRGLRYEHLTQNENKEKLSHPELVIGKFGVGLKDALATLYRHHVDIVIKSKHGDITIDKSSKLGFEDVITLHAMISSPTNPAIEGTEVRLSGCSGDDIEKAKNLFMKFAGEHILEKTDYGEILKRINPVSNIYINGVKVAEEENFLFSYNITSLTSSMRKALNRERTNVGRTAYTDRVKSILLSSKTKTVVQLLVEDLAKYQQGIQHDELKYNDIAIHACKMLNSISNVVFVTPQQLQMDTMSIDNVRRDGYEVVVIPEAIRAKITNEKDVLGNVIRDLRQYNVEYNASFEFKFIEKKNLNKDEVLVFEKTDDIFKLIGGKPSVIDKVLISETMRREDAGFEAAGVWESDKRRIVIKRDQLRNLANYAGTLLHETAHAISHADDISREFESALTELLGITASKSAGEKSD